jgi:predicted dinucleotide-binding enzyme
VTYAIIGSGAIGSAIASHFARKGIDVLISNRRGPTSLAELVRKLGPNITAGSVRDALRAEVVFLAVPFAVASAALRDGAEWNGRIVVDATNAIDLPRFTPTDLGGRPSSEVVADWVPGARVVKAFNTLPAAVLALDPAQDGGRRVLFLSGNDAAANQEIARLIDRLGFAPIVLGNLQEGGRLQQFGGPLIAHNLVKKG